MIFTNKSLVTKALEDPDKNIQKKVKQELLAIAITTFNILVNSIFNDVTTLTTDTIIMPASNILSIIALRINIIIPGVLKEIYAILLLFLLPGRGVAGP